MTNSFAEDRSLSWSMNTSGWQALMRLFLTILIYFASHYMATTFKDLIPDVTKFLCRSNKYPQTISWTVCIRCAKVSLINSKPYWHCTNKRLSNIIHSRAFQKLKTVVKRDEWKEDQSRNFRGQKWKNRERSTGESSKQRETCQRWWEARRMLSMESERTVHKRRRLQFPPRWEQTWKSNATVLSCSTTADSKATGKILREEKLETARPCHVMFGILPCVKNHKTQSGCRFGEKCAIPEKKLRWSRIFLRVDQWSKNTPYQ